MGGGLMSLSRASRWLINLDKIWLSFWYRTFKSSWFFNVQRGSLSEIALHTYTFFICAIRKWVFLKRVLNSTFIGLIVPHAFVIIFWGVQTDSATFNCKNILKTNHTAHRSISFKVSLRLFLLETTKFYFKSDLGLFGFKHFDTFIEFVLHQSSYQSFTIVFMVYNYSIYFAIYVYMLLSVLYIFGVKCFDICLLRCSCIGSLSNFNVLRYLRHVVGCYHWACG